MVASNLCPASTQQPPPDARWNTGGGLAFIRHAVGLRTAPLEWPSRAKRRPLPDELALLHAQEDTSMRAP